jgi:flagellar biosynthetic protein FliP
VLRRIIAALLLAVLVWLTLDGVAGAQVAEIPQPPVPAAPTPPAPAGAPGVPAPGGAEDGQASISLDLGDATEKPSQSITIILLLTVIAVAPALLMMLTSFTRIVIVLSLTRNALGLQSIPPNQVVVGLALFLSLFVMGPTLSQVNEQGLQPFLKGDKSQSQAFEDGAKPLRKFMLKQTGKSELTMFNAAAEGKRPKNADDVSLTALIPAFVLSELKTAFIIGFIVFVPFLVIDIVVSSSLMSMGMMMLPPVMVSLPFKLLLFVMVDGWALVVKSLLSSF